MSVEGSSIIAKEVVGEVSPIHASLLVEQFKGSAATFKKALSTAINLNDGLYVYEFSQIEKYNYWDELRDILKGGSKPASTVPVRAQ